MVACIIYLLYEPKLNKYLFNNTATRKNMGLSYAISIKKFINK